jgi:hypothetical protein
MILNFWRTINLNEKIVLFITCKEHLKSQHQNWIRRMSWMITLKRMISYLANAITQVWFMRQIHRYHFQWFLWVKYKNLVCCNL